MARRPTLCGKRQKAGSGKMKNQIQHNLFADIKTLIEQSKQQVAVAVNSTWQE